MLDILRKYAYYNGMKEEEIRNNFSKNLYALRKSKNLSQAQLAEKSQVSAAYISQIEGFRLHKGITCTAIISISEGK